jgi:3',5'-cyclic AMP phosphodiesterase CpdA
MARARNWLQSLGDPADVTVTPGNHDAYVRGAPDPAAIWAPWMTGDGGRTGFPFIRKRGPVAFIVLNTGCPTGVFQAWGSLGSGQLAAFEAALAETAAAGLCRIVLLHHPPAGKYAEGARKGLRDREAFARIVAARGAELVLHGHIHHWTRHALPGPAGPVPVLSAASASAAPVREQEAANWNLVRVTGEPGAWALSVEARGLGADGAFAPLRGGGPGAI